MAILDNPIFEYEEKKSVMTDENEAADAEAQGMSAEGGKDPVKLFAREMAKKWPIGTFKTINTLLLLALVLFAGFADQFNISWSKFNEAIPVYISSYGAWIPFQTLCQSFIAFFFVSLLFTVLYWIWRRKPEANKHLLGCIGIGDLTISIVAIPVLFNALLIYALMVTAEWKYFYPRLTNSSMNLTELTEYSITPRPYYYRNFWDSEEEVGGFHPPTTLRPILDWQIREMEQRKMKILVRMALDSSSLILLAILVLLNLISFFRIRKMIKRTNLWLRDFGEFHKESSKLDRRYASFWPNGLFKMLFWIVPFFSSLVNGRRWNIPHICLFSLVMFCHWLYFIRKTRFRSADDLKANEKPENGCKFRFVNLTFFDILFALNGILFYIYFIYYDLVKFALLLHLFHFFYLLILGGIEIFKGITIKLPQISISVTVNVVKEGEKEKTNVEGENGAKMPENGQQEEKKLLPI